MGRALGRDEVPSARGRTVEHSNGVVPVVTRIGTAFIQDPQ